MGIAQYVLHDKGADTSERVAWTETVNLGTRNPETAARVMAAYSMDQDRLKREAGVKNTGRKSKDHVLHVTLSWHADESKNLTKEEQIRAAKWFLREIKADDRQALIVAHNDEPQAHVHLVVSRVSPKDGRLLSSSFEKLNASKWAEKYERDRGKIFCHNRVINNEARRRGEYVRGEKDLPRPVYEQISKVANDNTRKQALLAQHRKRVAAIAKSQREMKARQKSEWKAMERAAKAERAKLRESTKRAVTKAVQEKRDGFRVRWEKQHHAHLAEKREFDLNEKSLRGRMQNAKKLVQWRELIGKKSEGKRVSTLAAAFQVFSHEGARRQALARQHAEQKKQLEASQKLAEKREAARVRATLPVKMAEKRQAFMAERQSMITIHRLENAKVKRRVLRIFGS